MAQVGFAGTCTAAPAPEVHEVKAVFVEPNTAFTLTMAVVIHLDQASISRSGSIFQPFWGGLGLDAFVDFRIQRAGTLIFF